MIGAGRVLANRPLADAGAAELEDEYFTLTSGVDRAA